MLEIANALYPVWVVLFMTVFVAIVAWAMWPTPEHRARMDDHANIPFRDDEPHGQGR